MPPTRAGVSVWGVEEVALLEGGLLDDDDEEEKAALVDAVCSGPRMAEYGSASASSVERWAGRRSAAGQPCC